MKIKSENMTTVMFSLFIQNKKLENDSCLKIRRFVAGLERLMFV